MEKGTPVSLYKGLLPGRKSIFGSGKWEYGKWKKVKGELKSCENGFHACTKDQIIGWIALFDILDRGIELYLTEANGKVIIEEEQVISSRARILRKLTESEIKKLRAEL